MAELARANFSTATELADLLVRSSDLSFRDAHHLVGAVVRAAVNRGLTADEIHSDLIAETAARMFGRAIILPADLVARAVDPRQAVESRRGSGGASAHDMAALLSRLGKELDADRAALEREQAALAQAESALSAAFLDLAGGPGRG